MDVITGGELKVVVAIFLKDPYSGCGTSCESGSSCTHLSIHWYYRSNQKKKARTVLKVV